MQTIIVPFGENFSIKTDTELGAFVIRVPRHLVYQEKDIGKSLFVDFPGGSGSVTLKEMDSIFGRYGVITKIMQLKPTKFMVTFNDARDAYDAMSNLDGAKVDGVPMRISLI